MALKSLHILLIIFSISPPLIISTSNKKPHVLKSKDFKLYLQDTLNKTDFMVVKGIGGPPVTSVTAPFGSIFMFRDPLTATPDPSSDRLGTMEMVATTSVLDGRSGIIVTVVTLNLNKGRRGLISLAGAMAYDKPSDCPVAGGTEDFLFVQGYVRFSPVQFKGSSSVFKCEFHLFWPPYAPFKE